MEMGGKYEEWTARARGLYGLRPAGAVPCLRWAAGMRCKGAGTVGVCEDCAVGPLRVAPRTWRAPGWTRERVVTWEPLADPRDVPHVADWALLMLRASDFGLVARRLPLSPRHGTDGYAIALHQPGVELVGDVVRGGNCDGRRLVVGAR